MCGSPIVPRAAQCPQCGESLHEAARGVSPTFRTGFVIERAWAIFKREMGPAMAFFWIAQIVRFGAYFAAVVIINFTLPQGLGFGNPAIGPMGMQPPFWVFLKGQAAQTFVFSLILCGISSLVMPGCTRCMLAVARGKPVDAMDVFRGGPFLLRYLGIELILSGVNFVFAVTVSLPASWLLLTAIQNGFRNPAEGYLAIGLMIVGMLLQTIVQLLTWPWVYILVDSNPPGIASLTQAFAMTRRHLVGMFLLSLMGILLAIGGASAICIGLLFVLPFGMLMMAVAYCELSGQRTIEG